MNAEAIPLTLEQATRILVDDAARRRFEDEVLYPGPSTVTDEEARVIDRFTKETCRAPETLKLRLTDFVTARQADILRTVDAYRLAAARRDACALDAAKDVPKEPIRFVFVSDETENERFLWRAELVVPGGATAETLLDVSVQLRDGRAAEGLFKLAGVVLPLQAGKASLPFGLFLLGLKDSNVALVSPDGQSLKGHLIFF